MHTYSTGDSMKALAERLFEGPFDVDFGEGLWGWPISPSLAAQQGSAGPSYTENVCCTPKIRHGWSVGWCREETVGISE
jgi:hypothetical protein